MSEHREHSLQSASLHNLLDFNKAVPKLPTLFFVESLCKSVTGQKRAAAPNNSASFPALKNPVKLDVNLWRSQLELLGRAVNHLKWDKKRQISEWLYAVSIQMVLYVQMCVCVWCGTMM